MIKRSCGAQVAAILTVLGLLGLLFGLTACDKNGKSASGGSSPCCFNNPSSDLNGGGYTGPDTLPSAPSPKADNVPPPPLFNGTTGGFDCAFLAASTMPGTGIDAVEKDGKIQLKGQVDTQCSRTPQRFNMYLEVYFLPFLSTTWRIVTGTSQLQPPIGTKANKMYFACKAGTYFIDMQATGNSSNGTPFKAGSQTVPVNITSDICSGR